MIRRPSLLSLIRESLRRSPVVSILGPRQVGKSTLARRFAAGRRATFFDLEDPADVARLTAPKTALESLQGLVVIDEIQRMPALFELLRVLADRPGIPARFLILGSADPRLVRGVSESLAGRVSHIDIAGFTLSETGVPNFRRLWTRGGFPRAYTAASDAASLAWRQNYIRDFLQRDLAQLGVTIPAAAIGRFWNMVAHFHGCVWSGAEFARSLGSSEPTARRYLDLLSDAWVVRQLPPWFENLGKRQVRHPKIYVQDSGLLHALLGLRTNDELMAHPKAGASWEGFVLEQILSLLRVSDAFFWGTHQGAELDLLVLHRGKRYGFEVKLSDAPTLTKSMAMALKDLRLDRLFVVHPGTARYPLHDKVEVVPILALPSSVENLS